MRGGFFAGFIQFKDYSTNEVVFNLYLKIDEEDLVSVEPMLYSEVPSEDARVELDFEILYDIIYTSEKEMRGIQTESPPWDKRKFEPVKKIKEVATGAKMWLKGRQLMSSAKYYPESAEKDMDFFMKEMFSEMFGGPGGGPGDKGMKEGPGGCTSEEECREYCENPENREECMKFSDKKPESWEDKEIITGEVIRE